MLLVSQPSQVLMKDQEKKRAAKASAINAKVEAKRIETPT